MSLFSKPKCLCAIYAVQPCLHLFYYRAHDALVFRNSPITDFLADALHVPGRGMRQSYHLLGDKAFPILVQLMTPYRDYAHNPLTHAQRIFNQHLSSKRQVSTYFRITKHIEASVDCHSCGKLHTSLSLVICIIYNWQLHLPQCLQ